jgi:hypothetical protein
MKNRGTENFHWWDFHHDWHPHSGEVIEEITLTIYVNGVEFVSLINLPSNGSHPRTERTPNDLEIESHVTGWLEMHYEPEGLNEQQMEQFEIMIDAWIQDHQHSQPRRSRSHLRTRYS